MKSIPKISFRVKIKSHCPLIRSRIRSRFKTSAITRLDITCESINDTGKMQPTKSVVKSYCRKLKRPTESKESTCSGSPVWMKRSYSHQLTFPTCAFVFVYTHEWQWAFGPLPLVEFRASHYRILTSRACRDRKKQKRYAIDESHNVPVPRISKPPIVVYNRVSNYSHSNIVANVTK